MTSISGLDMLAAAIEAIVEQRLKRTGVSAPRAPARDRTKTLASGLDALRSSALWETVQPSELERLVLQSILVSALKPAGANDPGFQRTVQRVHEAFLSSPDARLLLTRVTDELRR
jgi:hypothetical protein